jgi:hypothetical protein
MRHLGSIFLALLLAPAVWVLTGIGISKFADARANPSGLDIDLAVGLAAVLGAGLAYALLILPRLSPLGPVLAGLGLLGLVVWRVVDLDAFHRAVPADFLNVRLALRHPADGYAALLAMPLLGTLFSVRRWRRHEHPPDEYAPMEPVYQSTPPTDYPTVPNLPTAGHPPPPYQQTPYQTSGNDSTWPFPDDTETTRRL